MRTEVRAVLRSFRGAPGELRRSDHEHQTVCGHPGARYVLAEAATVLATGTPGDPVRLARAAAGWAAALETLEKPAQPTAFWVANETGLRDLTASIRSVERWARDLSRRTLDRGDARRQLSVALERYAAGIGPFLEQYADVLSCRHRALVVAATGA